MQIILDTKGLKMDRQRNMFYLESPDGKTRGISPHKVSSIAVTHSCTISSGAIELAAMHGIPIYFIGFTGKVTARLSSPYFESIATLRRRQVMFGLTEQATQWMVGLYMLKLEGQAGNLKWLPGGNSYAAQIEQQVYRFRQCLGQTVRQARPQLLAAEAVTAKLYWQALAEVLPDHVDFEKRSRRPAEDHFNAALNYLYAMLYTIVEQGLFAAGLDPHLGIFHADEYNKPVLAFDFIEPFRPWVDRLLLEQYLAHRVPAAFFTRRKEYGVILNKEGKAFLIPCFNEWLRSERLWGGKKTSVRNHIYQLAGRFANKLRQEAEAEEAATDTTEILPDQEAKAG